MSVIWDRATPSGTHTRLVHPLPTHMYLRIYYCFLGKKNPQKITSFTGTTKKLTNQK